ncbi:MAG: hypothetical protein V1806_04365 [Pseudomonadota bacterium]
MQISSIFGSSSSTSSYEDKQTFGAQVVSSTLDMMNNSGDSQDLGSITDKKTFGAAVVSKTMDYLNNKKDSSSGASGSLYELNKNVLGSYYGGTGGITNTVA